MNAEAAASRSRSGLAVLLDTIVAPLAAFEALRARTTWGLAYVITALLGVTGALLLLPASEHVVTATFAQTATHDPHVAALPPGRLAQVVTFALVGQKVAVALVPLSLLVGIAFGAVVCLVASVAGHGDATFARCFAFAANVAVVRWGLGALVTGALVALRGPQHFVAPHDLATAVPSLAWLTPGAGPKLLAFLATVNPFALWTFALVAIGLPVVARVGRATALVASAVMVFAESVLAAAVAK